MKETGEVNQMPIQLVHTFAFWHDFHHNLIQESYVYWGCYYMREQVQKLYILHLCYYY